MIIELTAINDQIYYLWRIYLENVEWAFVPCVLKFTATDFFLIILPVCCVCMYIQD